MGAMTRILLIERDAARRRGLRDDLARFDLLEVAELADLDSCRHTVIGGLAAIVANADMFAGPLTTLAGQLPVLLVAETPSIPQAVDCMRRGAADYLPMPLQSGALSAAVLRVGASDPPQRNAPPLRIGNSSPMRDLSARIAAAGAADSSALIQGESGSGKALAGPPPAETAAPSGSLESFFVSFVLENQHRFTETELASKLGISRKSLWERRQRLNIPRRRTRKRGVRQEQGGS